MMTVTSFNVTVTTCCRRHFVGATIGLNRSSTYRVSEISPVAE